jgi:hypothetical protein
LEISWFGLRNRPNRTQPLPCSIRGDPFGDPTLNPTDSPVGERRQEPSGEPVTELAREPGKELQGNRKRDSQGNRGRNFERASGTRLARESETKLSTHSGNWLRRMARESSCNEWNDGKYGKRGLRPKAPDNSEVTMSCDLGTEPGLRKIG